MRFTAARALGALLIWAVVGCGGRLPAPALPAPALPPGGEVATPATPVAPMGSPAVRLPGVDASTSRALADLVVPHLDGPTLEVRFMDVGQGDSILIRTPEGRVVLVDTGPRRGRRHLARALRQLGVKTIDLLINTHGHADHIGGFPKIAQRFPVKNMLDQGLPHPTPTYKRMLDTVERLRIPFKLARRGRHIQVGARLKLDILGPDEPLLSGTRSDINSNSVVSRLTFGQITFLLMGDAEDPTEGRLLRADAKGLRSTVLKVAHHGSRFATHPSFLRAVAPRLAVISCGKKNRYGHPAPATLRRLRSAGVATFVTAEVGDVVMHTDGLHLTVEISGGRSPKPTATGAAPTPALVDINTADERALRGLPGVGAGIARRILEFRAAHGAFRTVEELLRVKGIGAGRLGKLRALVVALPSP